MYVPRHAPRHDRDAGGAADLLAAKAALRDQVWAALSAARVARFPGAAGRISNFTGAGGGGAAAAAGAGTETPASAPEPRHARPASVAPAATARLPC
jgi:hypothetical protein